MSNLGLRKRDKLNILLRSWPAGTVGTQAWLAQRGITRQLSHAYKTRGWITQLGQGAFIKAGDKVDWKGGLYALQHQLSLKLHLGGLSALVLQGASHFLTLGQTIVLHLYPSNRSEKKHRLPKWFLQGFEDAQIYYHPRLLFSQPIGLKEWQEANFSFTIASIERALMELLASLPQTTTYDHALLLFQGKLSLRPELIQQLLECCLSYKVKRLFLHCATQCQLPWLERLELGKVDLGRGKRQLAGGGRYDKRYQIALPNISPFDDSNTQVEV